MSTILEALRKAKEGQSDEQEASPTDMALRDIPQHRSLNVSEERRERQARSNRSFFLGFISAGLAVGLVGGIAIWIALGRGGDSVSVETAMAPAPSEPVSVAPSVSTEASLTPDPTPAPVSTPVPIAEVEESVVAEADPIVETPVVETITVEPELPPAVEPKESPAVVAVAVVAPGPEKTTASAASSVSKVEPTPAKVEAEPKKQDIPSLPPGFKPVPKATPKPPELEFAVQGIIWDDASPLAVVNRTPVSVGDEVDDATVLEIKKTSVILETEGVKFSIRIHGVPEILDL